MDALARLALVAVLGASTNAQTIHVVDSGVPAPAADHRSVTSRPALADKP
jgi:hypothetical protein